MRPWRSRRSKLSTTRRAADRLLTIVLVHDVEGKRPDQMFYCTKLDWTARQILSAYACRWAIECASQNCKQLLGLEDPANRLPKAVERTAPMAFADHLQLGDCLVSPDGSSIGSLSVQPLVPQEARTVVRRHTDDLEASQLRGENRGTTSRTVSAENLDRPASPSFSVGRAEQRFVCGLQTITWRHDRLAGGNFTHRPAPAPSRNLRNAN